MSLQVWLPLNGDLHNQGLRQNLNIIGTNITFSNNGKIGKCADFNGTSSRIYIPNFSIDNQWSYGCWVNTPTSDTRGWELVIILNNSGSDADSQLAFWIHQKENRIESLANTKYTSTIPYTPYYNSWHHFFATYNGTVLTSYIDGTVVKTQTITDEKYTGTNLTIGARCTAVNGSSFSSFFQGSLNDVRIYNHCLSIKEVKEIAKGLVLHYKLDNNGLGNPNLAKPSTNTTSTTSSHELKETTFSGWDNYANQNIALTTEEWANMVGKQITYSMWMKNISQTKGTGTGIMIHFRYADGTYQQFGGGKNGTSGSYLTQGEEGLLKLTVTVPNPATRSNPTTINYVQYSIRHNSSDGVSTVQYKDAKIEKGSIITPWAPYSDLDNIIYDSSGYNNNGAVVGTLEAITPSPKYSCAIKFDGSSSTIKVLENKWMAQHAQAMTINIWVKNSSWSNGANMKFFSCTESGGFNCEAGNSGYIRFPIYVCTNAEQTTYAYKYDSKEMQASALTANNWNMVTFVYNSTGTKTYINGQLHHTYTNTSYGIHFNTNARLFLGCEANTANPSSPYYNGQMSDFRLYYTALTAEQVKDLYKDSLIVNGTTKIPRDLE